MLTYLLPKCRYRHRYRDISSISYRYRIEIEKVASKHHWDRCTDTGLVKLTPFRYGTCYYAEGFWKSGVVRNRSPRQ